MPVGRLFLYDTDSFWLSISWICVIVMPLTSRGNCYNFTPDVILFSRVLFLAFLIIQIPDFPNVRISANFPISEYPIFRFSVFPIFRISDFPIFQLSDFPNSRFPLINTSDFPIFRFSEFLIFRFSDFLIFRFSEFRNFWISEWPILRIRNKQIKISGYFR